MHCNKIEYNIVVGHRPSTICDGNEHEPLCHAWLLI